MRASIFILCLIYTLKIVWDRSASTKFCLNCRERLLNKEEQAGKVLCEECLRKNRAITQHEYHLYDCYIYGNYYTD